MLQRIVLGNRELGTAEIYSNGVSWGTAENDDKVLYLKVDVENAQVIDMFYHQMKVGDMLEGVHSNKPYFEILGVEIPDKISTNLYSKEQLEEEFFGWSFYNKTLPENAVFLLKIN